MKVLLYINKLKDEKGAWREKFIKLFSKLSVDFLEISDEDLEREISADAIFVFGGDGTILKLTSFVNKNKIPVVGVNAGNVGFLSEFEPEEIKDAIKTFLDGKLKKDERLTISVSVFDKTFLALNDVVVERTFEVNSRASVTNLSVDINGKFIDKIIGDGVVISTPTGSTAYSMAAGGAILAPGINALSMTPISARTLHNRPIIFCAEQGCTIKYVGGSETGLFVDGKYVLSLKEGDIVNVSKLDEPTVFLRKSNSDFYNRLIEKLNRNIK